MNTRPQTQSSSGVTGTSTLYNPGSPRSSTSDRASSIQTSSSDGQMIADALASIRDKVRIEQARPGRKWSTQNRLSYRFKYKLYMTGNSYCDHDKVTKGTWM